MLTSEKRKARTPRVSSTYKQLLCCRELLGLSSKPPHYVKTSPFLVIPYKTAILHNTRPMFHFNVTRVGIKLKMCCWKRNYPSQGTSLFNDRSKCLFGVCTAIPNSPITTFSSIQKSVYILMCSINFYQISKRRFLFQKISFRHFNSNYFHTNKNRLL